MSMHSTWNRCRHLGSSLTISPSRAWPRQTAHSTDVALPLRSMAFWYAKVGREAMVEGASSGCGESRSVDAAVVMRRWWRQRRSRRRPKRMTKNMVREAAKEMNMSTSLAPLLSLFESRDRKIHELAVDMVSALDDGYRAAGGLSLSFTRLADGTRIVMWSSLWLSFSPKFGLTRT